MLVLSLHSTHESSGHIAHRSKASATKEVVGLAGPLQLPRSLRIVSALEVGIKISLYRLNTCWDVTSKILDAMEGLQIQLGSF
mmetsp:Transcript_37672/g.67041  ORF Transcript_37672/g.67041 Transcript_37672/m.67041 type:complete len:83 (-) Transcript_37672:522-770(-)